MPYAVAGSEIHQEVPFHHSDPIFIRNIHPLDTGTPTSHTEHRYSQHRRIRRSDVQPPPGRADACELPGIYMVRSDVPVSLRAGHPVGPAVYLDHDHHCHDIRRRNKE